MVGGVGALSGETASPGCRLGSFCRLDPHNLGYSCVSISGTWESAGGTSLRPKSGVEHSGNNSGGAPLGSVTVDRCPRMCKQVCKRVPVFGPLPKLVSQSRASWWKLRLESAKAFGVTLRQPTRSFLE